MAIGTYKHSRKKAKRFVARVARGGIYENSTLGFNAKKGAIHFEVWRTLNTGGAYMARACTLSHATWTREYRANGPSVRAYKKHNRTDGSRCVVAQGNGPTIAVKRALAGLLKKL